MPSLFSFALSWFVVAVVSAAAMSASPEDVNLVCDVPGNVASISVDSSFAGYHPDVLVDGRWIAKGQETVAAWGDPDQFGNHGNTWVSQEELTDHWIQVDWPAPVRLNEIRIIWSQQQWQPRCFQIQRRIDDHWEAIHSSVPAWEATDRESVIRTPVCDVQSLRIVQIEGGHRTRTLMAAQEISAYLSDGRAATSQGARGLNEAELRRILPRPLLANIARLHEQEPGASVSWTFDGDGKTTGCANLTDGDVQAAAAVSTDAIGVGIQWPVSHMVNQATLIFADATPAPDQVVLETYDGRGWDSVPHLLDSGAVVSEHKLVWTFEPLATRFLRARFTAGRIDPPLAELEVSRYLPSDKSAWPARLTQRDGLQREMLADKQDPSFEKLAQNSLSMTPVRTFVGVKDDVSEVGVAWDGTLLGRETIRFKIGKTQAGLGDSRETLRRTLLDGWLPAVQLTARVDDLEVLQTVFSVAVGDDKSQAVTFVRVQLKNLTSEAVNCPIQAIVQGERPDKLTWSDHALQRGDDVVLLAKTPNVASPGEGDNMLQVEVTVEPHAEVCVDFVHPNAPNAGNTARAVLAAETLSYGEAHSTAWAVGSQSCRCRSVGGARTARAAHVPSRSCSAVRQC